MRTQLANSLNSIARWIRGKAGQVTSRSSAGESIDAYRKHREPTSRQLLYELVNTAYTCASINASTCASFQPKLYVTTSKSQPDPKCLTRCVSRKTEERLRDSPPWQSLTRKAQKVEEVLEHPLLALLERVNSFFGGWDLFEITSLYQESEGNCYWQLLFDGMSVPSEIWVLPSQNVTPMREPNSTNVIDYYEVRYGADARKLSPEEVVHFAYPNPRDPYGRGLSPLRAVYESHACSREYLAYKRSVWDHAGLPHAIISPEEIIGEDEEKRIETQWRNRFQRGGAGDVLVAQSKLKVDILSHSVGDLAALAEYASSKEDVANAFQVPNSYLSSETNLANLEAAQRQHTSNAIRPRLLRRDSKLNEKLVPLFDPSGRLFLAADDPVPETADQRLKQEEQDLRLGVLSINQVRAVRGLDPVPWGEFPWLPLETKPSNDHVARQIIISDITSDITTDDEDVENE